MNRKFLLFILIVLSCSKNYGMKRVLKSFKSIRSALGLVRVDDTILQQRCVKYDEKECPVLTFKKGRELFNKGYDKEMFSIARKNYNYDGLIEEINCEYSKSLIQAYYDLCQIEVSLDEAVECFSAIIKKTLKNNLDEFIVDGQVLDAYDVDEYIKEINQDLSSVRSAIYSIKKSPDFEFEREKIDKFAIYKRVVNLHNSSGKIKDVGAFLKDLRDASLQEEKEDDL